MARKKNYKPGDIVWTQGCESSEWYECRVLEMLTPGNYLLESPAHGYAIQRHYSELERSPK